MSLDNLAHEMDQHHLNVTVKALFEYQDAKQACYTAHLRYYELYDALRDDQMEEYEAAWMAEARRRKENSG